MQLRCASARFSGAIGRGGFAHRVSTAGSGEREVRSERLGELVMKRLRALDTYV